MANQNPGFWISRLAGTDIVAPVTDESVIWDTANARFKFWNGTIWTPAAAGLYDVVTGNPAVNVQNTVTTTAVYTTSIPGGLLGTKGVWTLRFIGSVENNTASSQNVDWDIKFGGSQIATTGNISMVSTIRQPILLDFAMAALGATNQQRYAARFTIGTTNNGIFAAITSDLIAHGSFSVDSTVAQTFQINVTLGVAASTLQYEHWATWVTFIAGP